MMNKKMVGEDFMRYHRLCSFIAQIIIFLCWSSIAYADGYLFLSETSDSEGQSVEFNIDFSSLPHNVIAINFDLKYNNAQLTYSNASLGPVAKSLGMREHENGTITFVVDRQNSNLDNGHLLTITFQKKSNINSCNKFYFLTNIGATDINGISIPLHLSHDEDTHIIPGDIDGDGDVDGADLRKFAASFLSSPSDANYETAFDVDWIAGIANGDMSIFAKYFGE